MTADTPAATPDMGECALVELRQYTLHPGRRDELIDLFEREFLETQEACGMTVIGHFRDLDAADRFVWLRGFTDNDSRTRALAAFYGGPVWHAHREAANATMIDSDDVLLLRPAWHGAGFDFGRHARLPLGAATSNATWIARICAFDAPVGQDFIDFFAREVSPLLRGMGAASLAAYATEYAINGFPALPVREGGHVFVWFARFADDEVLASFFTTLSRSPRWNDEILPRLQRWLREKPPQLRLRPAARSLLR
jgi:hypothetical protein